MKPGPGMRPIDRVAANPRWRALLTVLAPVVMASLLATCVFLSLRLDGSSGSPSYPAERCAFSWASRSLPAALSSPGRPPRVSSAPAGLPCRSIPRWSWWSRAPYRWSRNPVMTGLLSAMLGGAFMLRSVALAAIFVPVVALLMYLVNRFVKEPELEQRFGEAYRRYRAATPRFVPRLRAGRQRADRR